MKKTIIVVFLTLGIWLYFNLNDFIFQDTKKNSLFHNLNNQAKIEKTTQHEEQPKHFWKGQIMSIKEVCKKWGEDVFDLTKFKETNTHESVRAKMTCSLLKNQKQYYGIERHKIRNIFGVYSGHYFKDVIPTYLIETAKSKKQDTWQLVFLSDRNHKIANIIVHKNCCD